MKLEETILEFTKSFCEGLPFDDPAEECITKTRIKSALLKFSEGHSLGKRLTDKEREYIKRLYSDLEKEFGDDPGYHWILDSLGFIFGQE